MYYNIKDDLFIIDSDNLDLVETSLYGYSFDDILKCNDNEKTNKDFAHLAEAYIYVEKNDKTITIKQDYIGSWGLYIYKYENYFAISNSFMYLVDYVKKSHKITFNRDCANAYIVAGLCSLSYSETMINEIEILDRTAYLEIDIANKNYKINYINYEENTIDISTEEQIYTKCKVFIQLLQ